MSLKLLKHNLLQSPILGNYGKNEQKIILMGKTSEITKWEFSKWTHGGQEISLILKKPCSR